MTNTAELKNKIAEHGLKYKFIAQQLGITYYGLQLKMENKSEFKASEIKTLCKLLDIKSLSERERIFFANEVDEKSTERK